jgi:hypothetical protein
VYAELIDLTTVEFAVINLQIIVFDMYSLYCTLTSMSKEENNKRLRRVTILKYVITITTGLSIVASMFFIFMYNLDPADFDVNGKQMTSECEKEIFCFDDRY